MTNDPTTKSPTATLLTRPDLFDSFDSAVGPKIGTAHTRCRETNYRVCRVFDLRVRLAVPPVRHGAHTNVLLSLLPTVVLFVGDLLEPLDNFTVEFFLDRYMRHGC